MSALAKRKFLWTLALMAGVFAIGIGAPAKEVDRYGDPLPPGALARLGTIRLRRGYQVFRLPDRDTVLSVCPEDENTAVCIWRTTTGELLRRFVLPLRRVGAAVSPDGKTLALSGYHDQHRTKHAFLYDVSSGKKTSELAGAALTFALAFSPDGKIIAADGDDKMIHLWDRNSGAELRRFQGANAFLNCLTFSPDGKTLASAGIDRGTVHLWDVATGRELRVLNDGPGRRSTVVFSPDGKTIATASSDSKTVRLWDAAAGKETRQWTSELGISALALSPNGKILAAGCTPEPGKIQTTSPIHLWDVGSGREARQLAGHVFTVTSLLFSADGKKLISSGSGSTLRVWDVATGKDLLPFAEHESWIMSVAFSPDGRSLASGSLDGTIRLWEAATGKPARVFEGGPHPQVLHVAFSPDGRTLISDQPDGSLRVWDVATGRQTRRFPVNDGPYSSTFAYSPDGGTLAVRHRDATIRLLDAATGKERRRLTGGASDGSWLCFAPDGGKLASMSFSYRTRSGVLQLWDAVTGAELHKWTVAQAGPIVFSADGRSIMGGTGKWYLTAGLTERTFHLWNIASGEDRPFTTVQQAPIHSLTASVDGRMLAWGDTAGIVTLWDLAAGQVRRRLKGHLSYIQSLTFSPDGKTLASGSADTTVLLWDATGAPLDGPIGPLSAERLSSLWSDLANKDAGKAFGAIGLLSTSAEQAVPLLKSKLRPAPAAERRQVARLIVDLDSDEFTVRQKAMEQLRQLDERAEPGLREALKDKLTLETRKRIEELLEGVRISAVSPQRLRDLRAIEVLEYLDTADARQALKTLADGAPHARLTREAKASLERLAKRRPSRP